MRLDYIHFFRDNNDFQVFLQAIHILAWSPKGLQLHFRPPEAATLIPYPICSNSADQTIWYSCAFLSAEEGGGQSHLSLHGAGGKVMRSVNNKGGACMCSPNFMAISFSHLKTSWVLISHFKLKVRHERSVWNSVRHFILRATWE